MYSRKNLFNYFTKQARQKNCLTETQIGSVSGIDSVACYSRLLIFVCLDPNDHRNSIHLQFTFWDSAVNVVIINRKPVVPESPVPAVYEDSVIEVINPDPNNSRLKLFSWWLEWAHQIVCQYPATSI